MGTVFRRHYRDAHGNRRECATWTVRLCRDGQRIELPSGTTKRGEALTTLKLLEGDAARGIPVTATGQKLTVDHAMAEVIADYRQNGRRTVGDLEQRWTGHLRPWFGGRKIACLTTACVRAYIMARLETGAKPATVNRELAVLRRGFSLAVKDGRIMHKPFVPTLAEHNTRVGFFDREQFEAVRRHLAEPLRPVVTFGFLTGWRVPSEVLTLRWAQVDFGAGTVRLNPGSTKNGDGRTLVFSDMPEMIALLKTQRVLTDAVQ